MLAQATHFGQAPSSEQGTVAGHIIVFGTLIESNIKMRTSTCDGFIGLEVQPELPLVGRTHIFGSDPSLTLCNSEHVATW